MFQSKSSFWSLILIEMWEICLTERSGKMYYICTISACRFDIKYSRVVVSNNGFPIYRFLRVVDVRQAR